MQKDTNERILRLPVVLDRVPLSRASIYKRCKEGTFPPPVEIGPRAIGWRESEINDWIKARITVDTTGASRVPNSLRNRDKSKRKAHSPAV
jgi:prophage regulatory protein